MVVDANGMSHTPAGMPGGGRFQSKPDGMPDDVAPPAADGGEGERDPLIRLAGRLGGRLHVSYLGAGGVCSISSGWDADRRIIARPDGDGWRYRRESWRKPRLREIVSLPEAHQTAGMWLAGTLMDIMDRDESDWYEETGDGPVDKDGYVSASEDRLVDACHAWLDDAGGRPEGERG